MKKILAVVLGLVLVIGLFAVIALVPYKLGYLIVDRLPGATGSSWVVYWIAGMSLITTGLVVVNLWKVAYEGICNWFGWH